MASLYNPPSVNATQKTLGAALLTGATASVTLNSVTSIVDGLGAFVVDRVDANGVSTASKREYITFTGVSGSTLTGLTRSADGGGSDQDHAVGAIVEFVSDVVQAKAVKDVIETEHTTAGVHTTATVTTLKATGAEINTGTEDGKIVTPKAIADSDIPSGLTPARETWAYASATTITIPAGGLLKYAVGDKIKLTQTTVKYFYVVTVADELLTVTGGSDYTVANAAITNNYYSHTENPVGFPTYFNYTPAVTSGSGTLTTVSATGQFVLRNQQCFVRMRITITDKGSGATDIRPGLPIKADGSVGSYSGCGQSYGSFIALSVGLTGTTLANIRKYDASFYADNGQTLNASLLYFID